VFTIQLGSLEWVSEFFEVRAQVDLGLTTVDQLLRLIKNLGRHRSGASVATTGAWDSATVAGKMRPCMDLARRGAKG
jgi:hypothetical protein